MTPPPALSPPALHFLILDFTITCATMEFTFKCTTDTAVHLTLHLGTNRPILRRIPYIKRGTDFTLSSVTCFVVTDTYDQDEAGDTFDHTFTVPIAAYDLPYYWYLTGTHGGQPSHSMSQIFNVTCQKPTAPTERCQAINPPHYSHDTYPCLFLSSCFQPIQSFTATSCDVTFQNAHDPTRICTDGRFSIWTAATNGRPSVQLYETPFVNPNIAPDAVVTVNVPIPDLLLAAASQYAVSYGFKDYARRPGTKTIKFLFSFGLSCEYTVPPSRHVWIRRFGNWYSWPCYTLLQDWYTYLYDRNLWFKFYGQDA